MNLKKKGVLSLLLNIAAGVVTLGNSFLIARSLSVEQYGLFSLANTIIFLFIQFSDLGLNDIIFKKIPLLKEKKSFIKSVIFLNSIIGIFAGLILILFSNSISNFYSQPNLISLLYLGGGFVFVGSFFTFLSRVFDSIKKFHLSILMRFLDGLFKLLLNICILLFFSFNSFFAVFNSFLAQLVIVLGVIFIVYKSFFKVRLKELSFYKKILIQALPFALIPVFSYFISYINNFILGYIVGIVDVGLYTIAKFPYKVFGFITPVFTVIITPLFIEKKDISKLFKKTLKYFYLICIPISLILFFKSKEIILTLFGEKYIIANILFKIMSLSLFQSGINQILFSYFFAENSPKRILFYNLFLMIIQTIVSFFMIFFFQSIGAVISEILIKFFSLLFLMFKTKKTIEIKELFKTIFISLIPCVFLILNLFGKAWINLIFDSFLYLIFVGFLYLIFNELKDIENSIKKVSIFK